MVGRAYYNEREPFAVEWLRNLIDEGLIAPGDVDDRDVRDVEPDDLDGYEQCHFFAGIGGWSLALRVAGWPDDRPAWTASCPCQPFSTAGLQEGLDDDRHLWPVVARLLRERRPPVVFGEQVASRLGLEWLDAVSADLEGAGYAFGAADLCAASVGAPHIRQRLFWVGNTDVYGTGWDPGRLPRSEESGELRSLVDGSADAGVDDGLADDDEQRREREPEARLRRGASGYDADGRGSRDRMADAESDGRERREGAAGSAGRRGAAHDGGDHEGWHDVELVECREPGGVKLRPLAPGVEPLVDGFPGRVGQVRAYGNAIVPQVAAEFIRAAMT